MAIFNYLVLAALAAYQKLVSPFLPDACRYYPSCSAYAAEAVRRYGAFRGGFVAARRILRCHPWCHGGHDPVE